MAQQRLTKAAQREKRRDRVMSFVLSDLSIREIVEGVPASAWRLIPVDTRSGRGPLDDGEVRDLELRLTRWVRSPAYGISPDNGSGRAPGAPFGIVANGSPQPGRATPFKQRWWRFSRGLSKGAAVPPVNRKYGQPWQGGGE